MVRYNSVQVATGYDQSLSDSDNIESFDPSTSNFAPNFPGVGVLDIWVDGDPQYSRGQDRFDPSAGFDQAGFEQVIYNTPRIHVDAVAWLIANKQGQVTANLRLEDTTYVAYNALLRFRVVGIGIGDWRSLDWIFTLIEAIA